MLGDDAAVDADGETRLALVLRGVFTRQLFARQQGCLAVGAW